MSPIRLGVIGLSTQGWASSALIPPIFDPLLSSKYTLTALCTSSEASATVAATKYSSLVGHPVKAYFGEAGLNAIANDANVDMVVVSVKIPEHYKAIMPAIAAGKDIFVEWSPGKNLQETIAIAEAAKQRGIRSLVGAQAVQGNTVKKLKELVDSGQIGRLLSTSASLICPPEIHLWGATLRPSAQYTLDETNGASMLVIPLAHYLTALTFVLGDITTVSATAATHIKKVKVVDASGNPTGESDLVKNAYDQIILTGTLGGRHEGALVTINCQAGPSAGRFLWFVDGEDGIIEARNRPENGAPGAFASTAEMQVMLNNKEVELETKEEDRLGNPGKAWLEFAKGTEGRYETLESSVRIWKILDAVLKSVEADGKSIPVI
ncbi:NAD-binding Rossmann fold oxidoreductase [Trametopsis cervina]|nr:NAD-binding Rossmann fold oxidoreductase [Trametopsis cervina]